jgi:eukaryotic-like serine/threonine-protein kinase
MTDYKGAEGQQFGDYRLLRWLGGGGFGNVYLGEHTQDSTQVAVKILQAKLAQSHDLKEFINEARTIRLLHPHIVRLLDFGIGEDDIPFLVMEYAPNGTLRHRHPRNTQVPLAAALTYVNAIASALQYAHDHHLIHRDVKPENMLIGPQQEIWLSDFGIAAVAQSTHSLVELHGISGTLPYMAPEQIHGKPRPASDQYALGIVAYEWLSGQRPFTGTTVELITQHITTPPPSLKALVPDLPDEVEQVVITALQKDPPQRFASVQAFAHALEQASHNTDPSIDLHTQPIALSEVTTPITTEQITPTTTTSSSHETPDKRPWLSRRIVIAGLASLLVVGGAGYFVSRGTSSPSTRTGNDAQGNTAQHSSTPQQKITPIVSPHTHIGRLLHTYRGHTSAIYAAQWSRYDLRIASVGEDKTVQVWNAFDDKNTFIYKKHADRVNATGWDRFDKNIVSASSDQTVHIWDAHNGATSLIYKQHNGAVLTACWSPAAGRIASGGNDKTVRVWTAADGSNTYVYLGHNGIVTNLAWSPDGLRIASCSKDRTVHIWNSANGNNPFIYKGHSASVRTVAWSPNGKYIATAGDDQTVQVWNSTTGHTIYVYRRHSAPITSVTWSANSQLIASGSEDHTVHVWNAMTGNSLYIYGQTGPVLCVAWSHSGKYMASGGDSTDPTVQIWDA